MRYTIKSRTEFPLAEDSRLWRALTELKIEFTKFKTINIENRFVVHAWIENKGAIIWKELYYCNHSHSGASNKTRKKHKELLQYCIDNHIPVLLLSRKSGTEVMKMTIRRWIMEIGKEK